MTIGGVKLAFAPAPNPCFILPLISGQRELAHDMLQRERQSDTASHLPLAVRFHSSSPVAAVAMPLHGVPVPALRWTPATSGAVIATVVAVIATATAAPTGSTSMAFAQ